MALRHQLPGLYRPFPGLSQTHLRKRTKAHIDPLLGGWVNVVKILEL